MKPKMGKEASTTMKDLLEFLETKAIELQPTQSERLYKLLTSDQKKRDPTRKMFYVKSEPDGCVNCKEVKVFQIEKPNVKLNVKKPSGPNLKCPLCKNFHPLYKCPILLTKKN